MSTTGFVPTIDTARIPLALAIRRRRRRGRVPARRGSGLRSLFWPRPSILLLMRKNVVRTLPNKTNVAKTNLVRESHLRPYTPREVQTRHVFGAGQLLMAQMPPSCRPMPQVASRAPPPGEFFIQVSLNSLSFRCLNFSTAAASPRTALPQPSHKISHLA